MANTDPSLSSLEAEILELRAALAQQRETFTQVIEQQQAAISALQQNPPPQPVAVMATPELTVVDAEPVSTASEAAASSAESRAEDTETQHKRSTSRRNLLRGAAAATAAAAAATVALSAAQPAHAAPLATGGSFILGQVNDADATTELVPTSGFNPLPLFRADNSGSSGISPAVEAFSQSVLGAVNAQASNGGTGLYVGSDTGLAINAIGTGRILQNLQGSAGAPTSGNYIIGEQIRDSNGEFWICIGSGSPGTWARVPHVAAGGSGGAITYLSKPIRLLDTRPGAQAAVTPGAKFGPGDHYVTTNGITYSSVTVPGGTNGILGNLTILNATGAGFVSLCPANVGFTGTANVAFGPGQVVSNAYTTGVGSYIVSIIPLHFATGIDVYINGSSTDVIVDLFAVVL